MKPRHAAALALVGWYLFVAPSTGMYNLADGMVRNPTVPLAYWEVRGHYDSLDDCREEAIKLFPEPVFMKKRRLYGLTKEHLYSYGVKRGYACVSSSDPRLKERN